jgi:exosortase B
MKVDAITADRRLLPTSSFVKERWPLLLGFAALIIPTLVRLARDVWTTDEGMHGIIVLTTGIWLVMREKPAVLQLATKASPALFWAIAIPGAGVYAFGRAFGFLSIEVAALLGLMIAVGYFYLGAKAIRHLWFPILYLCFLVPPPGWVIDAITAPLKTYISVGATELLQMFGYPIVSEGVMLYIDQYQLLVEDACAGLNSIVSLTAIGLFYIYLLHRASWRYSLFLLCWIVPMAVLANFVRVLALVLITYHFGDAMAQGFLHSTAGILMFITALAGIFAVDGLAGPLRRRLERGGTQ